MPRRKIILEAFSPLLLGAGSANDTLQASRAYVAGSAWRGALAGSVLHSLGRHHASGRSLVPAPPDPTFSTAFLGDHAARFSFLYPVRASGDALGNIEALPIPLTAQSCKQHPGFAPQGHGVVDSLLARLRHEALLTAGTAAGTPALRSCPQCDQRLNRLSGAMHRSWAGTPLYAAVEVRTRSFVRVGLNRSTETAQDQVLYVLDALVPGEDGPLTFLGSWWGSDAQLRALTDLLGTHLLPDGHGYYLTIGADRARGMGRARLQLAQVSAVDSLEARLESIQPRHNKQLIDARHVYASLTLRSPLLLVDEYGLPARQVTVDTLRAYAERPPPGLELIERCSIVQHDRSGGWSSAWGLPKPVGPAFAAGSVLALRAPLHERDILLRYLATLELRGLGERTAEGWGETLVCDPFHLDYDEGALAARSTP